MTTWLREWLTGLIATAMVLSLLYALVPKGTMRVMIRFTGGLVLLLAVLRPLLRVNVEELQLHYREYQKEVDQQITLYQEENQEQMAAIIEEELAAYISKKTETMGLACRVQVETELRDGVPMPCRVSLDIPYDVSLSRWIKEETGIAEENQHWEVGR